MRVRFFFFWELIECGGTEHYHVGHIHAARSFTLPVLYTFLIGQQEEIGFIIIILLLRVPCYCSQTYVRYCLWPRMSVVVVGTTALPAGRVVIGFVIARIKYFFRHFRFELSARRITPVVLHIVLGPLCAR